jgi:head-tail adaptor
VRIDGQVISIGSLRQRVTLESVTEEVTTRGGVSGSPQVLARRLPARVIPRGGVHASEPVERGQQIDPRTEYDVVIRYRSDVTTRHHLRYHASGGDRLLEILSVIDVGARRRLHYLFFILGGG